MKNSVMKVTSRVGSVTKSGGCTLTNAKNEDKLAPLSTLMLRHHGARGRDDAKKTKIFRIEATP